MELLAESQKSFATDNYFDLISFINTNNKTVPVILVDDKGNILSSNNIDEHIENDSVALHEYMQTLKSSNKPIKIRLKNGNNFIYYGNSALITQLKYYPLALLLIIFLFLLLIYNYYNSTKIAVQNKLWAGMAKETAHQIGTPLSSIMGWIEILKSSDIDEGIIDELDKDVNRLQTITERFSKIGSEPTLEKHDVVEQINHALSYLKTRFSTKVAFEINSPAYPIYVMLNPPLFGWTFENLIKNAIDAMKGRGKITVDIIDDKDFINIYVSDTGIGIAPSNFKKVFEPGFTTKKRGWGLGLSLTKRIIEEYHQGQIKVDKSEAGKGTTFKISLKIKEKTR
jgi:signal transduction histidine kinase